MKMRLICFVVFLSFIIGETVYASRSVDPLEEKKSPVPSLNLSALSGAAVEDSFDRGSTSGTEKTRLFNEQNPLSEIFEALKEIFKNNLIFRGEKEERLNRAINFFESKAEEDREEARWMVDEFLRGPLNLLDSHKDSYEKLALSELKENPFVTCSPRENRMRLCRATAETIVHFRAFYITHNLVLKELFETIYEKADSDYLLRWGKMWQALAFLPDLVRNFEQLEQQDRFHLDQDKKSKPLKKVKKKRVRSKKSLKTLLFVSSEEIAAGCSSFSEREKREKMLQLAQVVKSREEPAPESEEKEKAQKTPRSLTRGFSKLTKSDRCLKGSGKTKE